MSGVQPANVVGGLGSFIGNATLGNTGGKPFQDINADPYKKYGGALNLHDLAFSTMLTGSGTAPLLGYDPSSGQLGNNGQAVKNPDILQALLGEQAGRYFGSPGQASWDQRFKSWFDTGPDGTPGQGGLMNITGQRALNKYGGRDENNNPIQATDSNLMKGLAAGFTAQRANNPWMSGNSWDPSKGMQAAAYIERGAAPGVDPNDYTSMMQKAMSSVPTGGQQASGFLGQLKGLSGFGGADDANYYGRKIESGGDLRAGNVAEDANAYMPQAAALGNRYEKDLTGAIDTEAQQTLGNRLQDTQNTMAAMGLGRSGAGQQLALQAQNDIMSQANRDKMRTVSSFRDQQLAREMQTLNQAQQIGGQAGLSAMDIASKGWMGAQDIMGRGALQQQDIMGRGGLTAMDAMSKSGDIGQQLMGQAAMGGLNNQFQGQQNAANRLLNQFGQERQMQGNLMQSDLAQYNQMLSTSGQQQLTAMGMEDTAQSNALKDMQSIYGMRQQDQSTQMQQLMSLLSAENARRQQQTNQMIETANSPWNQLQQLATGISGAGGYSGYGSTNPLLAAGTALGGNVLGKAFGGGSSSFPNYLTGLQDLGNPGG